MAETYDVYFDRADGEGLELIAVDISDLEQAIAFGPFDYNTGYSWRVDAVNEYGTTTGDVWTFTSIKFDPPLPSGVTLTDVPGEEGEPTGTPTGENAVIRVSRLVAAAHNKIWYEDL